jgi:hypothetical protein
VDSNRARKPSHFGSYAQASRRKVFPHPGLHGCDRGFEGRDRQGGRVPVGRGSLQGTVSAGVTVAECA